MNIRPNMMWLLAVAMLISGIAMAGCGRRVQRNPTLTKVPDAPDRPAQKGFLTRAGETTWNVVSAPARWVAPKKKPLEPQEPEVYEPADVIIMRPGANRMLPPAQNPPASPAATAPAN